MPRPVQYLFCKYVILDGDEPLSASAEFALVSENQGEEYEQGNDKNGVQPTVLCTEPSRIDVDGQRTHSFNIGLKQGYRVKQEYDSQRKEVKHSFEFDTHTKFGHIVSIPELGVMAVRDRGGDSMISATQTVRSFRTLVIGGLGDDADLSVTYSTDEDVDRALETWNLKDYRFTARPINPSAGPLGIARSRMYEAENVGMETSRVVATEGESLRVSDGALGQTKDMYDHGYAQIGFSGYTQEGQRASVPKQKFSQDKEKNLAIRNTKPRFIRVAFDPEDDIISSISRALVTFYNR